jgi:hypothetical protein
MKTNSRALVAVFLLLSLTMCKKDCDKDTPPTCDYKEIKDGLVAYYPFNGNANDESSNGNNATPKGGIQLTSNRTGKANSAYVFDGVDDYLDLAGTASLNPLRLSITLWFNMDNNGKMSLIGNNNTANGFPTLYNTALNYFAPGAHFMVRKSGTCGDFSNGPNEFVQVPFNFEPGKWYCYAATYDGLKAKIYVDGQLLGEQNITFQTIAQCTNTTFKIGRWWNGDPVPFKGKMDEVRIYNRGLSADEVKMLCATCNEQ